MLKEGGKYFRAKNSNIQDKQYINDLYKRANDVERAFRKEIIRTLAKSFNKKEERLCAIKTNKNYKWIGILYPAVFTEEKQILLMSVRKFLKKNSTIIEQSYDILKAEFLNNAIVFMDEFDATKADITNHIMRGLMIQVSFYTHLW